VRRARILGVLLILLLLFWLAPLLSPEPDAPVDDPVVEAPAPPAPAEQPERASLATFPVATPSPVRPERERPRPTERPEVPAETPAPTERTVRLRVDLVDAESGAAVDGEWDAKPAHDGGRVLRKDLLQVPRFAASGVAQDVELASGVLRRDVVLRVPSSRWPHGERVRAEVAADVRELVVQQPVSHAVPLRLFARDPEGRVTVPVVAGVVVGGRRVATEATSGDTETVIFLPFTAGAHAAVFLDWTPSRGSARQASAGDPQWKGALPESPFDELRAEVALTEPVPRPTDDAGEDLGRTLTEVEPVPHLSGDRERTRSLRVRLLSDDGGPVADGWVAAEGQKGAYAVARPGPDGKAVLEGLPSHAGFTLRVVAPGRLRASSWVTFPNDPEEPVTLREPKGASLEVSVATVEGRPLPFALVRPEALFFDVADGVQRVDLRTDAVGRRTFARVQPGRLRVAALWGDLRGEATVTLSDGERRSLRIVCGDASRGRPPRSRSPR
jgi:hypothetical protein